MALREIIAHFGFDFDKSKADAVDKHIHGIKVHSEEAAGGVTGLIEAFKVVAGLEIFRLAKEFTESLSEQAVEIQHTAEATGLSTAELQAWQFGAKGAGIDAQEFSMSLRRLSTALAGGADEGGSQTKVFAKLKIATKDAAGHARALGDVLPEIADHFQKTEDGAGKAALAQELFGRAGARMIPLLNKGADGIAELRKEFGELGGGFSPEAIERAEEFHHATVRLGAAFDSFKSQLAIGILPRVETLLQYLTTGVTRLTEFAHETTLVESAVASVATALVVTLGGALAPFLFGALKFAAIYLAVDDLKGFLNGQNSAIGSILNHWFGDGTADVVRAWVLDAEDWFIMGFDAMRATLPVFTNAFMGTIDQLNVEFGSFVLGIEQKWNGLIESLGLKDSFKIDTTTRVAQLAADTRSRDAHADKQFAAEDNAKRFAAESTPTSGATATGTAPIMTPGHQTYFNVVQGQQVTNITVPPGTPAKVTQDIAREVSKAGRESSRAALQALENRGG